jgi:hypothetical protein
MPTSVSASTDGWWWAQTDPANTLSVDEDTVWNAGKHAPAYIRFDFDPPVRCTHIELLPCMEPKSGRVLHQLVVDSTPRNFEFTATDRKWIRMDLANQTVKSIKIHTLETPSFVAWRRVRFWAR